MPIQTSHPPTGRRQRGSSMIEILIAILVLAIGMLGIAALQAISLRNTQGSAERSNAVIQSYSMLDAMRANRDQARAGNYNESWLCEAAEGASRIAVEKSAWIDQLRTTVSPTACGMIECGTTECEVGVRWNDSLASGGIEQQIISTKSRL